jgi:hypothetical protein
VILLHLTWFSAKQDEWQNIRLAKQFSTMHPARDSGLRRLLHCGTNPTGNQSRVEGLRWLNGYHATGAEQ